MAKRKTNQKEKDAGELIRTTWMGKDVVRRKGNTGKQAPVAKKQAAILGKASALSARIRAALDPILPAPLERKILNRLNSTIQNWLRQGQLAETGPVDGLPYISGHSFYGGDAVAAYLLHFSVTRTADAGIAIHITDIDPASCPGILSSPVKASLHFIAVSVNVADPVKTKSAALEIVITSANGIFPGQVLSLPINTSRGWMTIVAFSTNGRNVCIAGALYN